MEIVWSLRTEILKSSFEKQSISERAGKSWVLVAIFGWGAGLCCTHPPFRFSSVRSETSDPLGVTRQLSAHLTSAVPEPDSSPMVPAKKSLWLTFLSESQGKHGPFSLCFDDVAEWSYPWFSLFCHSTSCAYHAPVRTTLFQDLKEVTIQSETYNGRQLHVYSLDQVPKPRVTFSAPQVARWLVVNSTHKTVWALQMLFLCWMFLQLSVLRNSEICTSAGLFFS